MKSVYLLLVSLIGSISLVNAQTATSEENEQKPYIEVTGVAEINIIPDEIYISIELRERYESKEKITIDTQEEKLKASLKEIEIDISNLTLSDANAYYTRVRYKTKDVLAQKSYILKVNDAAKLGEVFKQLDKLEIWDADISRVDHTKLDSLKKAVRIKAIKAAKAKADYLLAAIGEQTGKTLIVMESEIPDINNQYQGNTNNNSSYANFRLMDYAETNTDNEVIRFRKVKLRSAIFVKFAIKE